MSDNGATTTQVRSESSAKYKVGDEVWVDGERCIISAAHDGKWGGVYTIVCRGRIVMSGASESTMGALAKKEAERKLRLFCSDLERMIREQEVSEDQASELRAHVEKIKRILAPTSVAP